MAQEIERKFLVTDNSVVNDLVGEEIIQGYLSDSPDATVRVRIKGPKAFLTVKSRNYGAVRGEWEYEIPVEDAKAILGQCKVSGLISKTRYRYGRWEIDLFHGHLDGLAIAEIELSSADETFNLPGFIGREVTDDTRYYNSVLAVSESKDVPFD